MIILPPVKWIVNNSFPIYKDGKILGVMVTYILNLLIHMDVRRSRRSRRNVETTSLLRLRLDVDVVKLRLAKT